MTRLDNKVALVTGASRGIGRAIAERLGSLGASVVVNYRGGQEQADAVVGAIERAGGKAVAMRADISVVAEIQALFAATLERFGRLDIVVANAGIAKNAPSILDFTEADYDLLYNLNAKGAFFTLQQAAKHVADNGRIVYIGSSTTAFPMIQHSLYGSSKMPGRFVVESLAKELGPRGVTVNTVLPTATEGAGLHADGLRPGVKATVETNYPMKRAGTPKDAADLVEFFVSDLAGYVSGQHLLASGGAPS